MARVGNAAGGAVLLLGVSFAFAQGGPGAAYSFSSGPSGDGFVWPRSHNSYVVETPTPGVFGVAGDQVTTPDAGVGFNNFTGNPAFFDSNNFLTKPAALINNAAWWTDPKATDNDVINGLAKLSFNFVNSEEGFAQLFGFDAAMVRVDADVPTVLPYTATDAFGNEVNGVLDFAGFSGATIDIGTFFSLGSPRIGREARFEFDVPSLFASFIGADSETRCSTG